MVWFLGKYSYFLNLLDQLITIISKRMGKLKIWAPQEDEILTKVSLEIKSKKWKKASEQLKNNGFERSDVECRQRYINHLDPCVNKQLWSEQELDILYTKYGQYGNKWFLLQKHLPGRTQTKIKNYFYGNIRFFLKIIIKYFHKKSTGFVNDIKTEVLLDMYQAKNSFRGFGIIPRTMKRLRYKVEKQACEKLIKQSEEDFELFTNHFMDNYFEKSNTTKESQSQEKLEDSESNRPRKIECQPLLPNQISLVSTVGGQAEDKLAELEHLKKMAMSHFGWYQHYQKAYMSLQQSLDSNS